MTVQQKPVATSVRAHVTGFHGVRYLVADVQKSIEFYRDVLGFAVAHQQLPAFATVTLDILRLHLSGPGSSGSRPLPGNGQQHPGGSNRIILRVRDLASVIDRLREDGARFRNEIEAGPGGRQIQLLDPDDNPIELHEPAQREQRGP